MDLNGLIGFWASDAGSLIQSIQTGEITIAAGASSNTATITSVSTANACVFFNGWRSADTSLNTAEDYPSLDLTNATTVTAQTNTANAGNARIVRYTVVEFKPFAIRSIQQGTISLGSGVASNTATISSVTTSRAFIMWLGNTHSGSSATYNYNNGRVSLTDATTVTAQRNSGALGTTLIVGYVVVEFSASIVKSVQQITSLTIAAGATTQDATISAVNDTAALLIWGGWNINLFAISDPRYMPYVYRTSTTNVRAARTNSNFAESVVNCTVVEFESRWIKSRQAAQTQIGSGASSANATVSSLNTAKSLLSWLNHTCSAQVSGTEAAYATAKINSATQVTVQRGSAPSNTVTNSWEVMEFV